MRRDDSFDPVDAIVRDALAADRPTAGRLAAEALAVRSTSTRFVPALAAFGVIVAGAVGLTRYAAGEPPIVIRGEGDTFTVESGSRFNRTIETFHDESPRGGVVVIREGGD